ncbi:hypothetical protein ABQJ48_19845 [Paraburkholderia sp. DGU8]
MAIMSITWSTATCIIRTAIIAMIMAPSRFHESTTQDRRLNIKNSRAAENPKVPKISRDALAAILLWSCAMVSLAWAVFLVLTHAR